MEFPSICFTGHRVVDPVLRESLVLRVRAILEKYMRDGQCVILRTGGAVGFDTIAADAVEGMAQGHPDVLFHMYLPCPEQDKYWNEQDRDEYERLMDTSDTVIYTSRIYGAGCMQLRNRKMLEGCVLCIAYLCRTAEGGGTLYTVNEAKKAGIPVISLGDSETVP